MTDNEIDALWLAHRDAGDMRAFARAVADAALAQAAELCSGVIFGQEPHKPYDAGITSGAHQCEDAINELRSER